MLKDKKRQDREDLLVQGRKSLELERLDPSNHAPTPKERALLKAKFGKSLPMDLAILERIERQGDRDCAVEIQSLEERTQDKGLRKEIRSALYRMKQKGLGLPESQGRTFTPPAEDRGIEAYLGPIYGNGDRIACLFKPIPSVGTLMIQSLVHDERGMLKMAGGVLPKKEFVRILNELKRTLKVVPADWKRVDAILWRAYRRAKDAGLAGIEDFPKLRAAFSSSEPPLPWSPVPDLFPQESGQNDISDEATARLLDEPELSDWGIPDAALTSFVEELEQAQESPVILSRYQRQDRIEAALQHAASELLGGPPRETVQRRLEEMTEYFHKTERIPEALRAYQASLHLRQWTQGKSLPSFFVGLVRRSLAIRLESEQRRKKDEISLIVRP